MANKQKHRLCATQTNFQCNYENEQETVGIEYTLLCLIRLRNNEDVFHIILFSYAFLNLNSYHCRLENVCYQRMHCICSTRNVCLRQPSLEIQTFLKDNGHSSLHQDNFTNEKSYYHTNLRPQPLLAFTSTVPRNQFHPRYRSKKLYIYIYLHARKAWYF